MEDPKETVRAGYDALSLLYRQDNDEPVHHKAWTSQLLEILPAPPAHILDLGCGCGVPVARDLARAGYLITGVDISGVQIDRAKKLVPQGTFYQADVANPHLTDIVPTSSQFDAIIGLYVLIHIPVAEQAALMQRMGAWVKNGGYCILTVGISPWTAEIRGWLGGDEKVKMWWSQTSAEEYRRWARDAGFEIVRDEEVKNYRDPDIEGHQFLLLRKTQSVAEQP
ncbi:S-adenosyl-L-methionine-dependent methyltransferase [Leucogyrophana mollusca]|uniref:S-adenosyl-L-methionine-dependent methyltransferase n=1 Tax=Leucogyrophana mollusca TaxID=85980 RepID=A0ACB8BUE5_9AGAM|nr:S-adenosyl-L-methionine-dependent methyltransferase [Leucogyrophana mollusca]